MGGYTIELLGSLGSVVFLRVSLFSRSSRFSISAFTRAFITNCFGYPRRMKWVISISAFNLKSSCSEHKRFICINCE